MHAYAENMAGDTMPDAGNAAAEPPVEGKAQQLKRQQNKRDDQEYDRNIGCPQPHHDGNARLFTGVSVFARLQWHAVKFQPVIHEPEAVFAGDLLLQSFDLGRVKFNDDAILQVDQVIVMLFRHGLVA
jgi:hypothetical protein